MVATVTGAAALGGYARAIWSVRSRGYVVPAVFVREALRAVVRSARSRREPAAVQWSVASADHQSGVDRYCVSGGVAVAGPAAMSAAVVYRGLGARRGVHHLTLERLAVSGHGPWHHQMHDGMPYGDVGAGMLDAPGYLAGGSVRWYGVDKLPFVAQRLSLRP